ncbi:SPOR domain-containing protein [Leptospira licerasiae]|uniref:Sporulation and cell division repeat protein n=1 Tax=Leptospira licerasiae str. MMD4847 TaxID=1049971 RepID=A0ABN0H6W6_9LEPT|nr:SPOR domain-containing protein [Leptospira licerasiae]EID99636.1 sporulation and cell division repeat protein [Leptospira licerasiae serovar Varillal str. VAR 010]EJZ41524.1 sporulation and cell division repeat protein [Leptospira licerasiae str. MMD4847]
MKEKVFYVINLDNKRISLLSLFLVGLLFSFFFLGVSVGRKRGQVQDDLALNSNRESLSSSTVNQAMEESSATSAVKKEEEVKFRNLPPGAEVVDLRSEVSPSKKEEPSKIDVEAPSSSHPEKKLVRKEKESKKSIHTSPRKTAVHKADNDFFVQVAAFKTKEKADELKSSLGGKSYVKKTKNGYFTVRMGNFPSKEDAERSMKKLPGNLKENALVSKE